jgi:hypothetical protein
MSDFSDETKFVLSLERKRTRKKLAEWMLENSFATGHGETFEDLLDELSWQIAEVRQREENRKALAPKFSAAHEENLLQHRMIR